MIYDSGQNNVVYVQKSIHESKSMEHCRRKCERHRHCKFWTYSAVESFETTTQSSENDHHHHNHTRVKRNHDGVSECGLRYRVFPKYCVNISVKLMVYLSNNKRPVRTISKYTGL